MQRTRDMRYLGSMHGLLGGIDGNMRGHTSKSAAMGEGCERQWAPVIMLLPKTQSRPRRGDLPETCGK